MDGQVRGVLISKFYVILTYLLPAAALGTKILASVLSFYKRRVEALFSKYKRGVRVPPQSDEYLRAVVLEALLRRLPRCASFSCISLKMRPKVDCSF